ncbi:MAG: enoyl-CoA hydratase-related protein [Rhodospirillales bacterium]|nr:enoyl-CoA hydratase-related protein [Rhodospirillales bacterium]
MDEVFPADELHAKVQEYAEELTTKPANALASVRRCIMEGTAGSFEEGLAIEKAEAVRLAGSANFDEGISAFLEKRDPIWERGKGLEPASILPYWLARR